ncbi:MAG: cation diffusion facilitator family transporter [Acidobacteriota bacterium]
MQHREREPTTEPKRTGWLERRLGGHSPASQEGRSRLGELEGALATGASVVLVTVKLWLWSRTHSVALLADAVNNLADVASSLIVLYSFRVARKPRDREHPYGHGRMEPVATLILATVLMGVAFEVAQNGVSRLLHPQALQIAPLDIGILAGTVALKVALAAVAAWLARLTGSTTLAADAWNHGFDVLSTGLVLGAFVAAAGGLPQVDGWAALGVAGFIAYTGYRYIRTAVNQLIGQAPDHRELHALHRMAAAVPGVYGVHDVIVHSYGDRQLISLHVEVDARQSALEVHELAERVEHAIAEKTGARVVVHADPVDHSHPQYRSVAAVLREVLAAHQDVVGFHDLRLFGEGDRIDMSVDLVVCTEVEPEIFEHVLVRLASRILANLPQVRMLDVGIEAEYASDREHRRVFVREEDGIRMADTALASAIGKVPGENES